LNNISTHSIRFERITHKSGLLPEIMEMYEEAFPSDERRDWEQFSQVLEHRSFRLEAIYCVSELVGMISLWDLADFCFIEHFAIMMEKRGQGFGEQTMRRIIQEKLSPIMLEVEKRTEFYKSLGFLLNPFEYFQPPYSPNKNKVKMMMMSYPNSIEASHFQEIKNCIYMNVYGYSEPN